MFMTIYDNAEKFSLKGLIGKDFVIKITTTANNKLSDVKLKLKFIGTITDNK